MAHSVVTSQCAVEAEAVLKILDDPRFTAEGYVKSVVEQIVDMTFPPSQVLPVRLKLIEFERQLRMRANNDTAGLRHEALQLLHFTQGLAQPVGAVPPQCAAEIGVVLKALNDPDVTAAALTPTIGIAGRAMIE